MKDREQHFVDAAIGEPVSFGNGIAGGNGSIEASISFQLARLWSKRSACFINDELYLDIYPASA